jgi:hypothetical protein
MLTAGNDFAFQFAEVSFSFMENATAVIRNSEHGRKFDFKFSTVDEYFQAIQEKKKAKGFDWPTYNGDFFPYNGNH